MTSYRGAPEIGVRAWQGITADDAAGARSEDREENRVPAETVERPLHRENIVAARLLPDSKESKLSLKRMMHEQHKPVFRHPQISKRAVKAFEVTVASAR